MNKKVLVYNKIYNCHYKELVKKIKKEKKKVDLIITDIPYSISRETNFKVIKQKTKKNGTTKYNGMSYDFDDWAKGDVKKYLKACCDILKIGGNIVIWSSWQQLGYVEGFLREFLGKDMREPRMGIWIKTDPIPSNCKSKAVNSFEVFTSVAKGKNATFNLTPFKNRIIKGDIVIKKGINFIGNKRKELLRDCIIVIEQGYQIINKSYERQVYIAPKVKRKGKHPTEKNLDVIMHMVETFSRKGELVFDGLIGSGVTMLAAKLLEREYIGCDINEGYVLNAEKRINNS